MNLDDKKINPQIKIALRLLKNKHIYGSYIYNVSNYNWKRLVSRQYAKNVFNLLNILEDNPNQKAFIDQSFSWEKTKQGEDFWRDIDSKVRDLFSIKQ